MIAFLLLIVGFLIGALGSSGTFGSGVITAFTLAHYWIWVVAIVLSAVAIINVIAALVNVPILKKRDENSSTKSVIFSTITAGFILTVTYSQIWLSGYIIDNISIDATSFSEIPSNTQFAISVFSALLYTSVLRTIFWVRLVRSSLGVSENCK